MFFNITRAGLSILREVLVCEKSGDISESAPFRMGTSQVTSMMEIPVTQPLFPKEHERLDIDKQIDFSFVTGFGSSHGLSAFEVALQDEYRGKAVAHGFSSFAR